jgi:hypothetical protein|tara:strand:+ start:74 stop:505 length:432 start_codon:yes stop_codon:yes gene_type:complete
MSDTQGVLLGMAKTQSDIDNATKIQNDSYVSISVSDDEYAKMKQDIMWPISYDSSNNISWNNRDDTIDPLSQENYETQKKELLEEYDIVKTQNPNYSKMTELNAAISTLEGIDPATIGGTSNYNIQYFMYQADNNYLHPCEVI